jgi:hypothetical protein
MAQGGDDMLRALKATFICAATMTPIAAHGACVQGDLTGTWRFEFNSGADVSGRTRMMSCLVNINATGAFSAANCKTIYATTDTGSIDFHTQRPLKINSACEVALGGAVVFGNDIEVTMGTTSFFVNGVRMTMNRSKDVMIGYWFTGDVGNVAVMAVKRD